MNKVCIFLFFLSVFACKKAEDPEYLREINAYRAKKVDDLLTYPKGSIISKNDTAFLDYFDIESKWKVKAHCITIDSNIFIKMPTSAGTEKIYKKHSRLVFTVGGQTDTLVAYQPYRKQLANYLFIPFRDQTSGTETYGGGRYLEIDIQDCEKNQVFLDFNKSYNPWCVYANGFFCPIPPKENDVSFKINAGEKMYLKP